MEMDMNEHESDDTNGDGEGVWSPDIEQCFREALLLFPPCGRRKHILQEEGGGKMYGRNELIARHIMMRTGKRRTRKQVSSHIQVLARRKAKAEAAGSQVSLSPANQGGQAVARQAARANNHFGPEEQLGYYDIWADRPIVTQKIRLVEFCAFIEYRSFAQTPAGSGEQLANSLEQQQQQQLAAANQQLGGYPQQANVLASNHQLPAQFNQATSYQATQQAGGQPSLQGASNNNSQLQSLNPQLQAKSQQQLLEPGAAHSGAGLPLGQHQPPAPAANTAGGFIRHAYVQIDYRRPLARQANKLERIDISQIQDKFPEIGGSDGLFQRGPADAFFLVKFWADLTNDHEYNIEDQNSYFGFSSHFETIDHYKDITCSTKACSYGLQVVEKVEKIYRDTSQQSSNGAPHSYVINRSPMCEFMIQFIKKLRQLPRASQMNSVLENFTVLQVITSESTSEVLLCLAYVFEVANMEQEHAGPQYNVYKLTKD